MSQFAVYLPQGNIGIELEAAKKEDRQQQRQDEVEIAMTGCRVRGWKRDSALAVRVIRGCRVLAVDDHGVEDEPFHVIVRRIRDSRRRKITFSAPDKRPNISPEITHGPSLHIGECFSCPTKPPSRRVKGDDVDKENKVANPMRKLQSPAQLMRLMQTQPREVLEEEIEVVETLCMFSSPTKFTRADADSRMLSPIVLSSRRIADSEQTKQLLTLRAAYELRESEVHNLEGQVLGLKKAAKGSAGQLLLMKFKLERTRNNAPILRPESSPSAMSPSTDLLQLDSLRHWKRFQTVLQELLSAEEHVMELDTVQGVGEGSDSVVLRGELDVQIALNRRLEQQLHEWVDQKIDMLKAAAVQEVVAKGEKGLQTSVVCRGMDKENESKDFKEISPVVGLPQSPPMGNGMTRHSSAHVKDEYGEERREAASADTRSLWMSARKSIYGASSPGNCLSPSSFKEHMRRLRNENHTIKDDIVKFRETLKVFQITPFSIKMKSNLFLFVLEITA
jgi:hypothetical protein